MMTKKYLLKDQHGFSVAVFAIATLVIGGILAIGFYISQHKNPNANTLSKTTVSQPSVWKTYTIPGENLSFKYPGSWRLDPDEPDSKIILAAVNSPGGKNSFGVSVLVGFSNLDENFNVLGNIPVTFAGQSAYLIFGNDTPGLREIHRAILSLDPNTVKVPTAVSRDDYSNMNIYITLEYSYYKTESRDDNKGLPSFEAAANDSKYATAKRIVESMHY